MKIITGDITNIERGIIIHQVNNKGVMGAGVAKSIRAKYPSHYTDYSRASLQLGSLVCSRISNTFGVIGMVSQNGYGRDKNVIYTDYSAFRSCLEQIRVFYNKNPRIKYYMPYNIGCGLANGNWSVISAMIEEICPFITLIKFDNKSSYQPNYEPAFFF